MKDNLLSRRSFVKMSTASVAALSIPAIMNAAGNSSDVPQTPQTPQTPQRPQGQMPIPPQWLPKTVSPGWDAGDADSFTRYYFDSLMLESRYIDSDIPSTKLNLFGETFDTPIMTAALSHIRGTADESGLAVFAKAAKECNAVFWMGTGSDAELEEVVATGARTVKIIKPFEENAEVIRRIKHAEGLGCLAVGMDIDHSFNMRGGYDIVMGQRMKSKSTSDIKSFVNATKLPFIVKGVLSVADAKRCLDAGVSGIVISHHGGRLPYAIPPLVALEQIAQAVKGKMKIFVDCGIVSGVDAYKCLALGADAVGVGRHLMFLVQEGVDATAKRMKEMNDELAGVMSATGIMSLDKMDPTVVHHTIL